MIWAYAFAAYQSLKCIQLTARDEQTNVWDGLDWFRSLGANGFGYRVLGLGVAAVGRI